MRIQSRLRYLSIVEFLQKKKKELDTLDVFIVATDLRVTIYISASLINCEINIPICNVVIDARLELIRLRSRDFHTSLNLETITIPVHVD